MHVALGDGLPLGPVELEDPVVSRSAWMRSRSTGLAPNIGGMVTPSCVSAGWK
jgi:hypothetical protein